MTIAALVARAPLRVGAKGDAVLALQIALRAHGHQLVADKVFGQITLAAVERFQAANGLRPDGVVGPLTAAALDGIKAAPVEQPLPSSLAVAPHLSVMRAITGTKEFPGAADNPIILSWVTEIVARYPSLKAGIGWYRHDVTAWCGLAGAYCVAMAGEKPPAEPLYVLNWRRATEMVRLQGPTLGAIGILERTMADGKPGGHLTMYEGEDATHWYGRGGNQSDQVNVVKFPHGRAVTWLWPARLAVPNTGRVKTTFAAAVSAREA